jgi:hypothetical protein
VLAEQFRVLRGRPKFVTEQQILAGLVQLKALAKAGRIKVTTRDGRLVDLDTMVAATPLPPARTAPEFLPDSAARDLPSGEMVPIMPGGIPLSLDAAPPSIPLPPMKDLPETSEDEEASLEELADADLSHVSEDEEAEEAAPDMGSGIPGALPGTLPVGTPVQPYKGAPQKAKSRRR